MKNVAIVGAGIIGMTNAVCLLKEGFSVMVFTKDEPLETNSDAAVANWFAPDNSKPLLQAYCIKSISKLSELMDKEGPSSGINKVPLILYFRSEEDFKTSIWSSDFLRKELNIKELKSTDDFYSKVKISGFEFAILIHNFLIHPAIYRPYMLKKFSDLGGILKKKK